MSPCSTGHSDKYVRVTVLYTCVRARSVYTHTPFLKDTSTCGGIVVGTAHQPSSLCACWVGTAHLAPAFGTRLGFTVCLPSRRKRRENATFSPTYIPVTHSHTRLYHDLCYEVMNEPTCRCHLCPYVFMGKRCMCSLVMSGVLKLHMGCDRVVTTDGTGYPHVNQYFYRFLNYYILSKG